jgi:proteic killer suppression protein
VIKSFRDEETAKIWNQEQSRKISKSIQQVALRKSIMLHRSQGIEDLKISPGNRLEKLKGNRRGEYSIRINGQWRICFTWRDSDAFDVTIVDYH